MLDRFFSLRQGFRYLGRGLGRGNPSLAALGLAVVVMRLWRRISRNSQPLIVRLEAGESIGVRVHGPGDKPARAEQES